MARPKSKNKAVCQNEKCFYYQKMDDKEITKQGKNHAGHQRFLCKHCGVVFVETKGTPLYNRKLSERKIRLLCKELVEKKGIRAVERTTGIHRDTIGSYLSALAEHAVSISKYLTKDLDLSTYEVDEFWSFVKKNKKNLSPLARKNLQQVTSGVTP
jgi:transposase-like protein